MRTALRLLANRYGIGLVLAVVLLIVLGVSRLAAGPDSAPVAGPAIEPSVSSVDPTEGDDSVLSPVSPAPPSTSPGAAEPAAVAERFLAAWLKHDVAGEQWRQSLSPYATDTLLGKLKETDPAGVPADRLTGSVTIVSHDVTFVQANAPVDSGTVRLSVVAKDGRWLVDGVDWDRT
jgi:hypothetical protein